MAHASFPMQLCGETLPTYVSDSQSGKNWRHWLTWMWEPFEIRKEVLWQCLIFSFGATCLDFIRLFLGLKFVKGLSFWTIFHKIYWRDMLMNLSLSSTSDEFDSQFVSNSFVNSLNPIRRGKNLFRAQLHNFSWETSDSHFNVFSSKETTLVEVIFGV